MTAQLSTTNTVNLYSRDYYLWLQQTAQLITEGKFSEVDAANLIEEIKDMGRSEKRAIKTIPSPNEKRNLGVKSRGLL